jgi:histidyl-tRNA synthetase
MSKFGRLRGTKDVFAPGSAVWEKVIAGAAAVMKAYNYKLIITPTIEERALFVRGIGDNTDIVVKEMYDFKDKKGRDIVLRPEGTASVVRAYIENSLPEKSDVYYVGQMFRYERPQKGRDREFYQIGVESFGDGSALKDAEAVRLASDMIEATGISSFVININSVGCSECRPAYSAAIKKFFEAHKDKLCADCNNRLERAPMRVLDCKEEKCRELAKGAPKLADSICPKCKEHHAAVKSALNSVKVKYVENPTLVRGLDYYARTVFEFVTDKLGPQQNTILAGGRYDGLVRELGGKDVPAVGFAAGIERIIMVLEAEKGAIEAEPITAFIIYDAKFQNMAFTALDSLRRQKIASAMSFEAKSFKAQFREADSKKAKFAVIIGETEAAAASASVKNMATGAQEVIKIENLKAYFEK